MESRWPIAKHGGSRYTRDGWMEPILPEKRTLSATGRNAYFILEPGYFQILEGKEEGKDVRITITVLNETKKIDEVDTRVIEEKLFENGQIADINDTATLSTLTSQMLADENLRERCAERALVQAREMSWQKIAERHYRELYAPRLAGANSTLTPR